MVFPVVIYGYESWTTKKAECWRIDASFKLWCWRRLLRVSWTARRSKQFILREISPEYSLEDWCWSWNSNTLATWCEELTHLRRPWCWERLKAGGEGDGRGWDGWMASLTRWTWVWLKSGGWWRTGRPGMLQFMGLQRVRHDWATELNWTHTHTIPLYVYIYTLFTYFQYSIVYIVYVCIHIYIVCVCVYSLYIYMGFPGGTSGKEPTSRRWGDVGLIPGSGRSPGGGHGNPL